MRHIVRAGGDVITVTRAGNTSEYVVLYAPPPSVWMLPDEARDLANRLRGVADAITEEQRRAAAADPRQMSLPLLTVEKGNG